MSGDKIVGFRDSDQSKSMQAFHFAGGYFLEKTAAKLLPLEGTTSDVVEKIWFPLAKTGKISAWNYVGPYQDLGTLKDLEVANLQFAGK